MGLRKVADPNSDERVKLLVVDDDKVTRDLLSEVFESENYEVALASSAEQGLEYIRTQFFLVILSDIRMLGISGLELLSQLKSLSPKSVVILMTGFGSMAGAIQAIQQGAFDYISKPFVIEELKALVSRAVRHGHSLGKVDEKSQRASTAPAPKTLIGKSPQIVEVYKTLARAALSESSVLIIGESGTGKELVARAIHDNSPRRACPFVGVNCGALAENLLESELFGHVKGAFTGAVGTKQGLFEEVGQGTLFLDEIGDISPALQVKLLRVIQEGEFKPVGSNEIRKSKARLISATHHNLETLVKANRFREDLYYRLKVIAIKLPPLRERMEDLMELTHYFIGRCSDRNGKKISHISDEAFQLLLAYHWPGNIRELENAIERAVAMTRTMVLYPEDFPSEIGRGNSMETEVKSCDSSKKGSLENFEKIHIQRVLEESGGNQSKAAAKLGIDRKTLARKLKRYRLSISSEDSQ